jgi:hypothetical protein
MDLNKLNCMNYHVFEPESGDHWYAQQGLRSLYNYSKNSDMPFRELCTRMLDKGEVIINRQGAQLVLTMI